MKDLLIYYFMGCRGNFLATILTDKVTEVKFNHYDLRDIGSGGYQKMHSLQSCINHHARLNETYTLYNYPVNTFDDLFTAITNKNATAIRLLPFDADDLINSAHLALTKNHTIDYRPDELEGFCQHAYESMSEDALYRDKFNYVVYFRDLFNIDRIRQIYTDIKQTPLDPVLEPYIIHNYRLQQRLTEQDNLSTEMQQIIDQIRSRYPGNF